MLDELAVEIDDVQGSVVADVDATHGWLALQFTVESVTPSAHEVIRLDGEQAPRAVYSFVFPGSAIGGTSVEGVRRSLGPDEVGVSEPITGFNSHLAFYLLGAAILGRIHFVPAGTEMIRTLSLMYAPVFGPFTQVLFLFGAFAVLYSTFFVANAGQARMCADAMQVTGLSRKGHDAFRRNVRWLSGLFPFICLAVYCIFTAPKELVMFSGLMQAIMLPMLSAAALYFRYRRCDGRIVPTMLWDVFLWASAIGMLVTGVWAAKEALFKYFGG